ncbi:unnamed protein product, partial [Allacma fusca]
ISIM